MKGYFGVAGVAMPLAGTRLCRIALSDRCSNQESAPVLACYSVEPSQWEVNTFYLECSVYPMGLQLF